MQSSSVLGISERDSVVHVDVVSIIQGWTERSVGFGRDQISLDDRRLTTVAPSSLIR